MPNVSSSTLASGARQFVVHDAFEMTVCAWRVVHVVVDAHADHRVGVARRRGDDDALGAALQVRRGLLAGGEETGRLDDDVDAVVAPRDLGRLARLELLDLATVDREAGVGVLDLVRERAADRVVLQQERHRVRVAERVVDRDQLDVRLLAAGEDRPVNDRPMRPNPLMPTRTAICVSLGNLEDPTTAERKAPSPVVAASCPVPSGPAMGAATGSAPRARDCCGVDRQAVVGVVDELIDPAAVLADCARGGRCRRARSSRSRWPDSRSGRRGRARGRRPHGSRARPSTAKMLV